MNSHYQCCICARYNSQNNQWQHWIKDPYFALAVVDATNNSTWTQTGNICYVEWNENHSDIRHYWFYICEICEATSRPEGQTDDSQLHQSGQPVSYDCSPDYYGTSKCHHRCDLCLSNHRLETCQYRSDHAGVHRCLSCALAFEWGEQGNRIVTIQDGSVYA